MIYEASLKVQIRNDGGSTSIMQRQFLIIFSMVIMLPKSGCFGFVFNEQKFVIFSLTYLFYIACLTRFNDNMTKESSFDYVTEVLLIDRR